MPTMPGAIQRPTKKLAAKPAAAVRRPRPPVDDDDEEAAPARRGSENARQASSDAVQDGWDGAENQMSDPNYPTSPKVEKGGTFYFKFLQDKPYASVKIHWLDQITKGKKSFMCPQSEDCPLCQLGDIPKFEARFNIAELGEQSPKLRSLNVGQQQAEDFKTKHNDKRYGPLSSKFYSRTRPSGPGGRWKTEVFKRDSDLIDELEDLDLSKKVYVPDAAELGELVLWTKADALKEVNWSDLDKAASIISGDYDDDDES